MGEFNDRVYETVRRGPRGKVAAYGQIARLIGQPRKARFVGYAMHGNPDPWDCAAQTGIPCHRVVFKDGSLAPGFAFGGPDEQRARLAAEGVTFLDDGRVDMRTCQWDGRDAGGADGGAAADGPTAPPIDFDWAAELGE
ncbi:MGMT family protein [uncultured Senegalimassilia sp.]|uniref:MGMT family protein n=1 Tax=uncultured Senegalimassilia sp. TaxID=1714350 RepID=UPI0027DD7C35|nr:MGMT family protein [uncultured Senegalimassilia sp.]